MRAGLDMWKLLGVANRVCAMDLTMPLVDPDGDPALVAVEPWRRRRFDISPVNEIEGSRGLNML